MIEFPAIRWYDAPMQNSNVSRVGMVMLTWNQRDMTLEGLASLADLHAPPPEVVLVDNGSLDGTLEAVRHQYPKVKIIANPSNLGFCAANNSGAELLLRQPGLEYVMFVNNDIEIAPDCVNRLVAFMDSNPEAMSCGPMIFYHQPSDLVWAAGGRIFSDLSWFPPLGRDRPDPHWKRPRQVDYIHGCALLVRRSVIEQLGGFDERFFIYHDEVDWCHRMKQAGGQVWLVPEAKLWHKVTQAVGQHSPMMIYYTARNKLLFWWKHGRWSDLPKFYAFHLWKGLRIFAKVRNPWSLLALGKALIDALRGGFGRGHIEQARK